MQIFYNKITIQMSCIPQKRAGLVSERVNTLSSCDSLSQINVEKRADGIACRLLCAASRPASALQSLLARVSSDTHDGELRRDLDERIACLERTADRSK